MGRARSRTEQEQIVGRWRRSGRSARDYAAVAGVSVTSLYRWSKDAESATGPQLVEAVAREVEGSGAGCAWELELERGTLRVHTPLDAATATAVVAALVSSGRR